MAKNMYGAPNKIYVALGNVLYTSDGNGLIPAVLDAHVEQLQALRCVDEDAWLKLQSAHPIGGATGATGATGAAGAPGAAGALVLIATQTASSSASISFTSLGVFSTLMLKCSSIKLSTTGVLTLQVGTGGGPTWDTTAGDYSFALLNIADNAPPPVPGGDNQGVENSSGIVVAGVTTGAGLLPSVEITVFDAQTSGAHKNVHFQQYGLNSFTGNNTLYIGGGAFIGNTAVLTGLRLIPSAGNITSGTFSLYGLAS